MSTASPQAGRRDRRVSRAHAARAGGWRPVRGVVADQRGAILAMAVSLLGLIGVSGLAIDIGRGYLTKVRLARAADAAAIEAASNIRLGLAEAEQSARAVAAVNGVINGVNGVSLRFSFDTNAYGENTVLVRASRPLNTTLSRILGRNTLQVATDAVAAVPPVDMVLVLDQSGSLAAAGAWDDLQAAVNQFVGHFDDAIDQLGLVHFQARAADAIEISDLFTTPIANAVSGMSSAGDTNTGEGLRLAFEQMRSPVLRDRSAKIVVFFTNGRPTAFRDVIGGQERVIAVDRFSTGNLRGLLDDPDNLPMEHLASPDHCAGVPECYGWTEETVRAEARQKGIFWAQQIRNEGIMILTIGLGDPAASDPILTPDLDYLAQLANVGGGADPDQPQGGSYFAPSADDLVDIFDQVARDLLVRLAR